jgi:hypothetical protein
MSATINRKRSMSMLAAVGFTLTLAGCSTYHSAVSGNFSAEELTSAGGGAGIPLQVDGSVGGVRGAPLATAVSSAMPAAVAGAPVRYTACEPYTECAGDHLVWTFGPPEARPASAYPPALGTNLNWFGDYEPSPTNVSVKVALFQGGTPVASVSGQTDAASPNDPAFQALIADMAAQVMSGPDAFDRAGLP